MVCSNCTVNGFIYYLFPDIQTKVLGSGELQQKHSKPMNVETLQRCKVLTPTGETSNEKKNLEQVNSVKAFLPSTVNLDADSWDLYDIRETQKSDDETVLVPDVMYDSKDQSDADKQKQEIVPIVTGTHRKHYVPVGIGTVRQQKEVCFILDRTLLEMFRAIYIICI